MKIAIVSSFNFHYECIGFLCEVLQEHSISIFSNYDRYSYIEYFKSLFPNISSYPSFYVNNTILNMFDLVIKLSSNDTIISDNKVVSLLHLSDLKDISGKYISLTKFISGPDIINMFPVYKIPNFRVIFGKTITFIGFYEDIWCDFDFDFFIKHSVYTFNFIVWGDAVYPRLYSYRNINIFQNVNTNDLTNIISSSTFILSRKPPYINYDRFCGYFSLACSFKKPLIVDKKSQEIYGFPGIIFDQGYSEVVERLNSLTAYEYLDLVNQVEKFRDNSILQNKEKMDCLLASLNH